MPASPILGMVTAKATDTILFEGPIDLPRKNREALADSFSRLCDRALLVSNHAGKHSNIDQRALEATNAALERARAAFNEAML